MNRYDEYLFYDNPVPYYGSIDNENKTSLLIYPVKMINYLEFHLYINCLLLDKNSVPKPEVISMSYLQYLYYISETSGIPYLYMFKELLKMVLHIDKDESFKFFLNKEKNKAFFKIEEITYDENDFNNIVDIIFTQNCIEHIDDTIQKEVREDLEKAEAYKQNQNMYKMCSLEDQMICVMISTSLKLEDIYNLTIRKFSKTLQRVDFKLHYQIYLSAQMSGNIKFENDDALKHWMSDLEEKDKYKDVAVDIEEVRNKINKINK